MARRDEEKKRRRQKRQQRAGHQRQAPADIPEVARLAQLARLLQTPPPGSFPGGRDLSLARPDMVKLQFARWATEQEPGRSKSTNMENAARRGVLGDLPDLADHWIIEEYLWHGVPGDSWHPLEAFLAWAGTHFPPAAAEQLRQWKAAQIGLFEIGAVHDDTVTLQAWDPVQGTHTGPPLRAIALTVGGAPALGEEVGHVLLTYLAPWAPADNLYCAMGYSKTVTKRDARWLLLHLSLRHPTEACRSLPWKLHRAAAAEHLRQWQSREWHSWLGAQLQFPFWALVGTPPDAEAEILQVTELLPATPFQTKQFGIYLGVPSYKNGSLAAGGTMVEPFDVTSPNMLALAEYRAYRDRVGPPPGTRGLPPFTQVR